jgi:hypothetical protein
MAPVHGNAEIDLPDGVLTEFAVDPNGEGYVWGNAELSCGDALGLLCEAVNIGRSHYPPIPKLPGALEAA